MPDEKPFSEKRIEELKQRVVPMSALANRDRVTYVATAHYEHRGSQPVTFQCIYSAFVEPSEDGEQEEPYTRRFNIGEEWQPLDLGWLKDSAGLLMLENLTGRNRTTNPTEEEREEDTSKIIQIRNGAESKPWNIPPGFPHVGYPSDYNGLEVRCVKGKASCRLMVYPNR